MERVMHNIENVEGLKLLLAADDILDRAAQAKMVLVQIYSSKNEETWIKSLSDEVNQAFPSAIIVGASTTEDNLRNSAETGKTIIVFSFFKAAAVSKIASLCHPEDREARLQICREMDQYNDVARLMDFIEVVTAELELADKELLELSVIDKLTQVLNRSKTDDVLQKEVSRSERYGSTFSIILIDLDHFKIVNDVYGNIVGDRLLVEVASSIKSAVSRATDVLGRWGGDEFLAILPETNAVQAQLVAERLCMFIADKEFSAGLKLTCSIGVTSYVLGDSEQSMLVRADKALYEAKSEGRNQAVVKISD